MKRKWILYIIVLFLFVSSIFIYDYFHISGKAIQSASEISDSCSVTVIKYESLEWNKRTEYTLNAGQIQRVRELILNSSFTRVLSSTVHYYDHDMYDIQIVFDSQLDPLLIHSIGNEYISVTNQFAGKHLKINNNSWKVTLEAIIEELQND